MRIPQTLLSVVTVLFSAAFSAIAGPVAGCQDLTPPGTWTQTVSEGGDILTTLGNESSYQFVLGSPTVQNDASGQWDLIEAYTNATLILNNTPNAPWFNGCDETNQFWMNVSELWVKLRSTRYEATNAGYVELELCAKGSWFTYQAGFAGYPTVTNVPEDASNLPYTRTTVPLDWARLCVGVVVKLDIRPGACVNPLNVKSRGVLPVAICGSTSFKVGCIDVSSLRLQCVPPLRTQCTGLRNAPKSLMLKFDTQALVQNLPSDNDREVVTLVLTGQLKDGTPISGTDTVVILNKGKPAKTPGSKPGHTQGPKPDHGHGHGHGHGG